MLNNQEKNVLTIEQMEERKEAAVAKASAVNIERVEVTLECK